MESGAWLIDAPHLDPCMALGLCLGDEYVRITIIQGCRLVLHYIYLMHRCVKCGPHAGGQLRISWSELHREQWSSAKTQYTTQMSRSIRGILWRGVYISTNFHAETGSYVPAIHLAAMVHTIYTLTEKPQTLQAWKIYLDYGNVISEIIMV